MNDLIFRAAGGQIKRDKEYRSFEGGKYDHKGFLIKNFPLQAIVSLKKSVEIYRSLDFNTRTLNRFEAILGFSKEKIVMSNEIFRTK